MAKFAFESFVYDYPEWAKHHEFVGIHVKRVYEDGKEILTKDEELNVLVKVNEGILLPKHVNLYNRVTNERITATDYYLPLRNQELIPSVNYFSSGACNTEQEMGIRYKFMLDEALFILEHSVNVQGNYPLLSFLDEYLLGETIREISKDSNVKEKGIGLCRDGKDTFSIVVVDKCGDPNIIDIDLDELLDHFVAVELFKYEMSIVDY